jgi:hypothetical protein
MHSALHYTTHAFPSFRALSHFPDSFAELSKHRVGSGRTHPIQGLELERRAVWPAGRFSLRRAGEHILLLAPGASGVRRQASASPKLAANQVGSISPELRTREGGSSHTHTPHAVLCRADKATEASGLPCFTSRLRESTPVSGSS